jgi:hypothetical protein
MPQSAAPGTLRADVLARLGTPTAVHALPAGERLQYSQQPSGSQVFNLDFDVAGRLQRVEQALAPAGMARIVIDVWTAADVERDFGRPGRIDRVALFDGVVWNYRFKEIGTYRWLHVHLDPAGVVRKVMLTDEVYAEPDRR